MEFPITDSNNTGVQRNKLGQFRIGNKSYAHKGMPNIGRPPKWETPQDMYDSFVDYVNHCVDNTLIDVQYVGSKAIECEVPKAIGLTISGFCRFTQTIPNIFYEREKKTNFKEICLYIRSYFFSTNMELAMANLINPVLTARYEGISDKREISSNIITKVVFHVPKIEAPDTLSLESGDNDLIEGEDWSLI